LDSTFERDTGELFSKEKKKMEWKARLVEIKEMREALEALQTNE